MEQEIIRTDRPERASGTELTLVPSNKQLSNYLAHSSISEDDLIDTGRIWRVLKRYNKLIAVVSVICGLLALIYSLMLRPEYTATATLRYNNNTSIADVGAGDVAVASSRGNNWKAYATTLNLLSGRAVGEHVIKALELVSDNEFSGQLKQRSFFISPGSLFSLFKGGSSDSQPTPDANKAILSGAVSVFKRNIVVEEVRQTDLITVRYTSFKPETAAMVANQIADSFNALESAKQKGASRETLDILNGELSSVQSRLLLSEKKMTEFARKTGIVDLDESDNLISTRQASMNAEFIAVQSRRSELEVLIQTVNSADNKEVVQGLIDDPQIRSLRDQLTSVRTEYQKMSVIFQPEYPKLKALSSQITRIRANIVTEISRAIKDMEVEYKNLVDRENQLAEQIQTNNSEMLDLKDRSVALNILKREWESNKKLYEGLLEKVKRAGLAANLELNRIALVELAQVPSSKSSPNNAKHVAVGLSIGSFIGLALAFILALKDRQFRSIREVEDHANLPVLAVVPILDEAIDDESSAADRRDVALVTHAEPSSSIGETFRSLRTSLKYSLPGQDLNLIMITSSGPSEAKTTSTVNLATTFARNDVRTVIVDFDLRKPSLHKVFDLCREPGVTDSLVSQKVTVRPTGIDNLFVLTAGTSSPNPTEMIESEACRRLIRHLQKEFDMVLFDTSPVMGLADTLVLSQYANVVVMAVDLEKTNKDALKSSLGRLRRVNAPMAGVIVTKHQMQQTDDYRYDDGYYYSYSDVGSDENTKKLEAT